MREKAFYRLDEVAEILGLSRRTIYRMIKDGRLVSVKFGPGSQRIPHQALDNLINEGDPL